jgi:hypothetical protein
METKMSAFFVLNIWEEQLGGGRVEWKGEILDVDRGQTLRFEDWPELVDLIAGALGADGRREMQIARSGAGSGKEESNV